MGKFHLRKSQAMSGAAAIVDQSREWAKALVYAEARGPGDYGNALARVARSLGVGRAKLWALLYRPPKDVPASVYFSLFAAYQAQSSKRKLADDLAKTRRECGSDTVLIRVAAALGRAADALDSEHD